MNKGKKKTGKIIGEIIFALCTVLIWVPMYYLLISAFKVRGDIVKYPLQPMFEKMTLDNFSKAIVKMQFFASVRNTGFITIFALLMVVVFGALAGFALSRIKKKGFQAYYAFIVAIMVVPFIGVFIALIKQTVIMKIYGSIWAAVLIQAAWNMPFAIFLYTGFIGALPKELEESAYVDGCTMLRTFTDIFLPLLAPVTATCLIRSGVGIWNDYLVGISILSSTYNPTVMVGVSKFFGERVNEYGLAFAAVLLASLPFIILFIFLQKYFIKGLTAGAVKG